MGPLTFIDALYYSGITGTVLGYGDITPLVGPLKMLTVVESALGFAMLTGIVTWLINVGSGVSSRNGLALRLRHETQGTGDGVRLLERSLAHEAPADLHRRLQSMVQTIQQVLPFLHQFPILDLYYRSYDASLAPERMTRALAQAAIAGHVLVSDAAHQRLTMVVDDLGAAVRDLMQLMADQHLSHAVRMAMREPDPAPEQADRETVLTIARRLRPEHDVAERALPPEALQLAWRLRVWLEAMDQHTGWRMDGP